jgi:hypothetical protein
MGDRQARVDCAPREVVVRVGVRRAVAPCDPVAPPMPVQQQHRVGVERGVLVGRDFEFPALVEDARCANRRVLQPRDHIARCAWQAAHRLQHEFVVGDHLAARGAHEVRDSIRQPRFVQSRFDERRLVEPAHPLRVDGGVLRQPPELLGGHASAQGGEVAQCVVVGELALQPWGGRAWGVQKRAEGRPREVRVAVQVVVGEVGVLLQRAAVAFAPAAVVAHQRAARQPLDQRIQLAQRVAGEPRRQLAAQRPQHHRRVVARLAHNRGVLARRVGNLRRVHLRQPQGQLQPHQQPQSVAQAQIRAAGNPQARLQHVEPALLGGAQFALGGLQVGVWRVRVQVPAPVQDAARVDGLPVQQNRRAVHRDGAQPEIGLCAVAEASVAPHLRRKAIQARLRGRPRLRVGNLERLRPLWRVRLEMRVGDDVSVGVV